MEVLRYENQITIFDLLKNDDEKNVQVLNIGDCVFVVTKGEIEKHIIESTYGYSENQYGHHTDNGTVLERDYDRTFFDNIDDATAKAKNNLKYYNYIPKEDIEIVSTKAYSYIRKCDGRKMTAFICDIGNGKAYAKNFMTFCFIADYKKAFDYIKKNVERYEEVDYIPEPKNMYKTSNNDFWEYTEAYCVHSNI